MSSGRASDGGLVLGPPDRRRRPHVERLRVVGAGDGAVLAGRPLPHRPAVVGVERLGGQPQQRRAVPVLQHRPGGGVQLAVHPGVGAGVVDQRDQDARRRPARWTGRCPARGSGRPPGRGAAARPGRRSGPSTTRGRPARRPRCAGRPGRRRSGRSRWSRCRTGRCRAPARWRPGSATAAAAGSGRRRSGRSSCRRSRRTGRPARSRGRRARRPGRGRRWRCRTGRCRARSRRRAAAGRC